MKLMIVDDSLAIRRKIERCINTNMQLEIVTANNGADAIEIFTKEQPQAVTMDLTMPKIDGVDCVKELVAINPKVKILVISALNDKATSLQAIKNGAAGFLKKPFTDDALHNALQELFSPTDRHDY